MSPVGNVDILGCPWNLSSKHIPTIPCLNCPLCPKASLDVLGMSLVEISLNYYV